MAGKMWLRKRPGNQFFAATGGVASGPGTIGAPWTLAYALAGGGGLVQPADTINVRGGTYGGVFTSSLNGTSGHPVKVQAYSTERVTLDTNTTTTLTAGIDNVTQTIPVALPLITTNPSVITIDSEDIRVTVPTGNSYLLANRGWNGTTAASHLINAPVAMFANENIILGGSYTWIIGIECTNSETTRFNAVPGSNPFKRRGGGMQIQGTGNKFINCIIHDGADGFTTANQDPTGDWEVYGGLSYYGGWDSTDRGHGHAIYIHNVPPIVGTIDTSITLDYFNENGQIYTGGGGPLGNVNLNHHISAQAGIISSFGANRELLMGWDPGPLTDCSLSNSAIYAAGASATGFTLGYGAGTTTNFTMLGNYIAGQNTCAQGSGSGLTCTGNTFVGPVSFFPDAGNTKVAWKPGTGKTFVVMKNAYETGRANIAVFNWDHSATLDLDFSSFLNVNDHYVVRSAWDFFGTPITSGTYAGGTVNVAAQGLTVSAPVGLSAPAETGPEFNVYIVRKV